MFVFPLAATIVAAVFSVATWRASRNRGAALRVWSVALAQFTIGSAALAWGIAFGWTPAVYRIFYMFGAVLNVGWLGLGTLWLVWHRPAAIVATIALTVVSVWAAAVVATVDFVPQALTVLVRHELPAARDVMPVLARNLSRWYSITGSVVVLAGLGMSLAMRRNVAGLGLLAFGVVVAGVSSEFARAGFVTVFSVGLAAGIALMYTGFVRTTT
ncbi:MAG TPA: hypothetical protein VFA34_09280 [Actinomycetota bacterium]|nr:hypothetical protein [Actinomycetota bacterium]